MNSLIWIRFLAYGDRVVFERQRAYDAGVGATADALRSRLIRELRVALERTVAGDTERQPQGIVVRSDHSADGFLITTGGAPPQPTMQVSPSGTGVECSYDVSDSVPEDASRRGWLQVSFPSQQLVPAVILESGVSMRCDTASILCEQLLERLRSRTSPKAHPQDSTAASTKRKRLEKMRQTNQARATS